MVKYTYEKISILLAVGLIASGTISPNIVLATTNEGQQNNVTNTSSSSVNLVGTVDLTDRSYGIGAGNQQNLTEAEIPASSPAGAQVIQNSTSGLTWTVPDVKTLDPTTWASYQEVSINSIYTKLKNNYSVSGRIIGAGSLAINQRIYGNGYLTINDSFRLPLINISKDSMAVSDTFVNNFTISGENQKAMTTLFPIDENNVGAKKLSVSGFSVYDTTDGKDYSVPLAARSFSAGTTGDIILGVGITNGIPYTSNNGTSVTEEMFSFIYANISNVGPNVYSSSKPLEFEENTDYKTKIKDISDVLSESSELNDVSLTWLTEPSTATIGQGYAIVKATSTSTGMSTYVNIPYTVTQSSKVVGGDVTAKYVDTDGNKISDDVVTTGNVGDSYTTEQKAIDGYTFKEVQGNATGTFTDQAQTVTYVYTKNTITPTPNPNPSDEKKPSENKATLPQTGENESVSIFGMVIGIFMLIGTSILLLFKRKR